MEDQKLKVYCAGKTHALDTVRQVQALVRQYGVVTFDWTEAVERHGADHEGEPLDHATARRYAIDDMRGVQEANLVIAVPHERLCGILMEVGAAIRGGTPVLWLGQPPQRSVFWALDKMWKLPETWPECELDLNEVLHFITEHPGYHSAMYRRDLWRLSVEHGKLDEETKRLVSGPRGRTPGLLHPVDFRGLQESVDIEVAILDSEV